MNEYLVAASGHGSQFMVDPVKYTRQDAFKEALRWCSVADTIGGDALVIHEPTGRAWDASGRLLSRPAHVLLR